MAADTASGILACWLSAGRFEDAPDHIASALVCLVARGWLSARRLPDGEILYARGEALAVSVGLADSH